MGTNECSQPASKSSWYSHDFGDISMVLKMASFRKSTRQDELSKSVWRFVIWGIYFLQISNTANTDIIYHIVSRRWPLSYSTVMHYSK